MYDHNHCYKDSSSVADIKSMNFIDYGRKMERVADDAVRLTDYFAQRYSFSQLEYAVAKTSALSTAARWFMEYDMNKSFSQTDSITKTHINTPENYRVLRNKIFDERIALMLEGLFFCFFNAVSIVERHNASRKPQGQCKWREHSVGPCISSCGGPPIDESCPQSVF